MRHVAICTFLLLLVSGCKKNELDIRFNSPKKLYSLVVEGGINTFQKTQYIRLSLPVFDVDAVSEPVKGAKVSVNDGRNTILFKETSTPGIYSGFVNNNANYNNAYKLTINYNNKEYTAIDTLRQVVNIIDDFLPLRTAKRPDDSVHLTIPKHTFGFLNSSKWLIVYQKIPFWNPSKFDVTVGYNYTHTQGSPNSIYSLTNQTRSVNLHPNDFVTIYKFSLSDEYARYLYSIFQETDWKGFLSSVPGEIKGNLSEGALGFFYVTDVDIRRYRVKDLHY